MFGPNLQRECLDVTKQLYIIPVLGTLTDERARNLHAVTEHLEHHGCDYRVAEGRADSSKLEVMLREATRSGRERVYFNDADSLLEEPGRDSDGEICWPHRGLVMMSPEQTERYRATRSLPQSNGKPFRVFGPPCWGGDLGAILHHAKEIPRVPGFAWEDFLLCVRLAYRLEVEVDRSRTAYHLNHAAERVNGVVGLAANAHLLLEAKEPPTNEASRTIHQYLNNVLPVLFL